jgi:hypothetical protein
MEQSQASPQTPSQALPQHSGFFDPATLNSDDPNYEEIINGELNRLRSYIQDLHAAGVGTPSPSSMINKTLVTSSPYDLDEFSFSSPPTHAKSRGRRKSPQSAPPSLLNASIDESDITRVLRGSGSVHPAARVRRRDDIVKLETRQMEDHRAKNLMLKFYTQDPDKRTSNFKSGKQLSSKTWDKRTNEVEFASTVPTTSPRFPLRSSKSYRSLGSTVDTLDNVGTKAACPTHLISAPAKADFTHVRSKVSHIWSTLPKGQTAEGSRSRPRTAPSARPSDWLLKGIHQNI